MPLSKRKAPNCQFGAGHKIEIASAKTQANNSIISNAIANSKVIDGKVKPRVTLRRKASWRLNELYRLAVVRNRDRLFLAPDDWAFVLAATLACGQPGIVATAKHQGYFRWHGLDMLSLKEALRICRIVDISDDDLGQIITSVARYNAKNGAALMNSDTVAKKLQVTAKERALADLRSIGAIDQTIEARKDVARLEKQLRDREHKRAIRGATPRAIYETERAAKLERNKAEAIRRGVSLRTIQRENKREKMLMKDDSRRVVDASPYQYNNKPLATYQRQGEDCSASELSSAPLMSHCTKDGAGVASPQWQSKEADLLKSDESEGCFSERGASRAKKGAPGRDQSAAGFFRLKTGHPHLAEKYPLLLEFAA